jgi:hypothetical protein
MSATAAAAAGSTVPPSPPSPPPASSEARRIASVRSAEADQHELDAVALRIEAVARQIEAAADEMRSTSASLAASTDAEERVFLLNELTRMRRGELLLRREANELRDEENELRAMKNERVRDEIILSEQKVAWSVRVSPRIRWDRRPSLSVVRELESHCYYFSSSFMFSTGL